MGYFLIFGYVYNNSEPCTMTSGERLIWWCQKQNKSRIKTIIKRSSFGRSHSNRKQPLKLCSTAVWLIEWNKVCYGYGLYIHYWLMKSSSLFYNVIYLVAISQRDWKSYTLCNNILFCHNRLIIQLSLNLTSNISYKINIKRIL